VTRTRGSRRNPPNRFESVHSLPLEPGGADDPALEAEPESDPRTRLLPDHSRSIIAHNDSPDVGFSASVNPYRGCEHGCSYCLAPETRILRADMSAVALGDLRVGDELVGFDEFVPPAEGTRKLRKSVVEKIWWSKRPTIRLITDRAEVITTAEHRWLQARSFRWSRTQALAPGRQLRFLFDPSTCDFDADYRVGYVAGLSLGDGTFRFQPGWRSDKPGFPAACWRIEMIDREPLERCAGFLRLLGVETFLRPFDGGPSAGRPLQRIETRSLPRLEILDKILRRELETESYRRGFLAGFFDAEGSNGGSLRIRQLDRAPLQRVIRYASGLGFEFRLEPRENSASTVRLVGSVRDRMRFFAAVRPAIQRKIDGVFGIQPATDADPVLAIEAGPIRDVVDIQTSTGTFYAAGLATHNCYARPTHEYLGYSAGLDFETRILVKHDAPELLRRALASPRWKPTVIALSGVTDPYQPAERRLRLTRRCLSVLAEFRNPVGIVTKGYTVTRDVDLLAELARFSAASVSISLTTLDAEVQRCMEPRAASPRRRLAAIEQLARAGVPVGVLIAPIVPGLTDHEIPALLEAAAGAGARFAGRVVLRLPHGLKQLFEAWLREHFPDRADKVLSRLRALHGGELYDPSFGERQRGSGVFAQQISDLFELARRRHGLEPQGPALSSASFRRPGSGGEQLGLF
jgi:DNA repair photolyase